MMGAKFGDNSQPSSNHGSLGSKIINGVTHMCWGMVTEAQKSKVKTDSLDVQTGMGHQDHPVLYSGGQGTQVPGQRSEVSKITHWQR